MKRVIFNYPEERTPPGPFIALRIAPRSAGDQLSPLLPAQVDSAADRTVVPLALMEDLRVAESGSGGFAGLGGEPVSLPLFPVIIAIPNLTPIEVEVAGHPREELVLVGRDVLNRYRITLDGPGRRIEIVEP